MMKNYLVAILGLVILCFGLVGCEETTPTAPSTTSVGTRLVNLETWRTGVDGNISTLTNTMANKAETSTVNAISTRVGTLEGQSAANTYTKTQLYTQVEVDAQIAAAVTALKADQTWITGRTSTSGAGTTTGEWGELISTNGDLELWLERVSGDVSDELRTRDGVNDARFDLVVVNLDTDSSHDFKIDFEFEPEDGVGGLNIDLTATLTKAEASGNLAYKNPTRFPNPNADSVLRFDQDNTGRILKGDAEDFTVWIDIMQTTGGATDWDYDIRIKDKD